MVGGTVLYIANNEVRSQHMVMEFGMRSREAEDADEDMLAVAKVH